MARRRLEQLINERESDSDEEYEEEYRRKRPRWIKERVTYFDNYDDTDFSIRFRFSKASALSVLTSIEHDLEFSTDR